MAKLPEQKSKLRFDCIASTGSYPDFEQIRNNAGNLFFYFGDVPDRFGGSVHRKADKAITKTKNISSVYMPGITQTIAYGDVRGTKDALLFVFDADYTEINVFVARGQANNKQQLYFLLSDGELNAEIEYLKKRAVTEIVTSKNE